MNETYSPEPNSIEQPVPPAPVPPENREDPGFEEGMNLGVPRVYRNDRHLILENDPPLPTDMCIRSGKRAFRSFEVAVRNPRNPATWFGKQPTVVLSLGRKEFDNHRVAVALTWSILAVGVVMLLAGIFSQSVATMAVGVVAMAVSGLFRAASPVTGSASSEGSLKIRGACTAFLNRFTEE